MRHPNNPPKLTLIQPIRLERFEIHFSTIDQYYKSCENLYHVLQVTCTASECAMKLKDKIFFSGFSVGCCIPVNKEKVIC